MRRSESLLYALAETTSFYSLMKIEPRLPSKARCKLCNKKIRPSYWLSLETGIYKNKFSFFCNTRCMRRYAFPNNYKDICEE